MTEKEIEEVYEKIRWRIDKVNSEYLELIAKQIKKIGKLNPSSIRKLEQMRIYGANSAKIKRELAKALNIIEKEVEELLKKAIEEQYTGHDFKGVYRDRGAIPLEFNQRLQRYAKSLARQTAGEMLNFSNTTNIDEAYKEVVSDAIDAVARGVTDYNSAIRSSMRKLGGDGLQVTYESGYRRRMDSAIRQNILDGVRQVTQKASEMIGEQIGADGVELSAHPFSAQDHEPAQGRMYTLAEFEKMQSGEDFQDVDGNKYKGFRRPIGQWNCHHIVSYVILGVSPRRYTDEQLAQWKKQNHKGIEIDGKEYTVYQASQLMRQLETEVRKQKDIANTAKNYGDDVLRREAQAKIRDLKKKYTEVANAAGLRERPDKMVVESYSAPEPLRNAAGSAIIEVRHTTLTAEPNSITQYTTKGGGVDRNYYGTDGKQVKQISSYGHGHSVEEEMGNHGEHAHDYLYDENGKLTRTLRELTEEERKENGDIL